MALLHSIRAGAAAAALLAPAIATAQVLVPPPVTVPASSNFTVFFKAVPIGSEQIALTRSSDGWTITSSGRMGAPLDVVARRVQVRYTEDWKPIDLIVDATANGLPLTVQTVVTGTSAQTHVVKGTQSSDRTDPVAADALLLPSPFWGPFEAVAARLKTAAPGSIDAGVRGIVDDGDHGWRFVAGTDSDGVAARGHAADARGARSGERAD